MKKMLILSIVVVMLMILSVESFAFQIHIRGAGGVNFTVSAEASDDVKKIRDEVRRQGKYAKNQTLKLYGFLPDGKGAFLEDGKKLSDYSITSTAYLTVVASFNLNASGVTIKKSGRYYDGITYGIDANDIIYKYDATNYDWVKVDNAPADVVSILKTGKPLSESPTPTTTTTQSKPTEKYNKEILPSGTVWEKSGVYSGVESQSGEYRLSWAPHVYNQQSGKHEPVGRLSLIKTIRYGGQSSSDEVWGTPANIDADKLAMETNGDLVLYKNNQKVWSSGTGGNPGAYLKVLNAGMAAIYTRDGKEIIWQNGNKTGFDSSKAEGIKYVFGDKVLSSDMGYEGFKEGSCWVSKQKMYFMLWYAGCLSLYNSSTKQRVWQSNPIPQEEEKKLRVTAGAVVAGVVATTIAAVVEESKFYPLAMLISAAQKSGEPIPGSIFEMKSDGNVVMYCFPTYTSKEILWESKTGGNPGAYMQVLDCGQVAIFSSDGKRLLGQSGKKAIAVLDQLAEPKKLFGSIIKSNSTPEKGSAWVSNNGWYRLAWEESGDLTLYNVDGALAIWNSNTAGKGDRFCMQSDGNAVIYQGATPIWATNTSRAGAYMEVRDDGAIAIVPPEGGGILWTPNKKIVDWKMGTSVKSELIDDMEFPQGTCFSSTNSRLEWQYDGNLVLYLHDNQSVIWQSNTQNRGNDIYFHHGKLSIYEKNNANPIWTAGPGNNPGAVLKVTNQNFGIYASDGKTLLWQARDYEAEEKQKLEDIEKSKKEHARQVFERKRVISGEKIYPGTLKTSDANNYQLKFSADGNLEVWSIDEKMSWVNLIWQSGTKGQGAVLEMKTNGEAVIYNKNNVVCWSTNTFGNPGAHLLLFDDGLLVVRSADGIKNIWRSDEEGKPVAANKFTCREWLRPGISRVSPNGKYRLDWDNDRYLVLLDVNKKEIVWSIQSPIKDGIFRVLPDGNAVIYGSDGQIQWQTGTANNPGAELFVFDGGFIAMMSADGRKTLWRSDRRDLIYRDNFKNSDKLKMGASYISANGNYFLAWQEDGNLVLTGMNNNIIWQSNTANAGIALAMQKDGNLVMTNGTFKIWSTNTAGNPDAYARVSNSGYFAIVSADGNRELWRSDKEQRVKTVALLAANEPLMCGSSIKSANGNYRVELQANGNLVLLDKSNKTLWQSGTANQGKFLIMHSDGELEIFNSIGLNGSSIWRSHTEGNPGAYATVTNSGYFAIVSADGKKELWRSDKKPKGKSKITFHDGMLNKGSYWSSPNWNYSLEFQNDGKLVLFDKSGNPVWSAPVENRNIDKLEMVENGNFVLYSGFDEKWSTKTIGNPGAYLEVFDDGHIAVMSADGTKTLWDSRGKRNIVALGTTPPKGSQWVSPNKKYRLVWETTGNLVLYDNTNKVIWQTGTKDKGDSLKMLEDGNLVIYQGTNVIWSTGTNGNVGAYLEVLDAGQVAIFSGDGKKTLWQSGQGGLATKEKPEDLRNNIITCLAQPTVGQQWFSPNKKYRLQFGMPGAGGGKLILFDTANDKSVWVSPEAGNKLEVRDDGNVVIYAGTDIRWQTGTNGNPAAFLEVLDAGQLAVVSRDGKKILWQSGSGSVSSAEIFGVTITAAGPPDAASWAPSPSIIEPGSTPKFGSYWLSPNGTFKLVWDGNLELHAGYQPKPLFSTNTAGHADKFEVRKDGTAVISGSGVPWWTVGRAGNPGAYMEVLNEGMFAMFSEDGKTTLWQSKAGAAITQRKRAVNIPKISITAAETVKTNGGVTLVQTSTGTDGERWGIDATQQIYRHKGNNDWEKIPGLLVQVAVGNKSMVFGVNNAMDVFKYLGNYQWQGIFGKKIKSIITVKSNGVIIGTDEKNNQFAYTGNNFWLPYDESDEITSAKLSNTFIAPYKTNNGVEFTKILTGADGEIWGFNVYKEQVYRYSGNNNWEQISSGKIMDISVGNKDNVWVTAFDKYYMPHIYKYQGNNNWKQMPALPGGQHPSKVAVSGNEVLVLSAIYDVYRWTGSGWEKTNMRLKSIETKIDGTIIGVDFHYGNNTQYIYAGNGKWEEYKAELLKPKVAVSADNILKGKTIIKKSGEVNSNQQGAYCVDGNIKTKWCATNSGDKYVQFDLGKPYVINKWRVIHAGAGGESADYNTRNFILIKSNDKSTWDDVDYVFENKANVTVKTLSAPVSAQYIGLKITKGEQEGNNAARIYEFEVFGTVDTHPVISEPAVSTVTVPADTIMKGKPVGRQVPWKTNSGVTLTQISTGADGEEWGLDAGGRIYRHKSNNDWEQIPGLLKQVSVGNKDNIWGVNSADNIFRYKGNYQWEGIRGLLKQIAVGNKGEVWGVNSENKVFQWNGRGWDYISSKKMKSVSIESDGTIIGAAENDEQFQYKGNNEWLKIGASPSVEASAIQTTTTTTTSTTTPATGRQVPWKTNSGVTLTQISTGADGEEWGLDAGERIYRHKSNNDWEQIPGRLIQVAVGNKDNIWGVNSADYIFRYKGNNQWEGIGGRLKQISVGNKGEVWGVNSANKVFQWNGTGWNYISSKKMKSVSIESDGTVIGAAENDEQFQYKGNNEWLKIGAVTTTTSTPASSTPALVSKSILPPGSNLKPGENLSSPSGDIKLYFQTDGNLVLYNKSNIPIWTSGTWNNGDSFKMQDDGNPVIFKVGTPTWAPGTHGNPGAYMEVLDAGQVAVFSADGSKTLWQSGSGTVISINNKTYFPKATITVLKDRTINFLFHKKVDNSTGATGALNLARYELWKDDKFVENAASVTEKEAGTKFNVKFNTMESVRSTKGIKVFVKGVKAK